MNRKYEVDEILEMVENTKRRWPHIYLETQVIYGFPSLSSGIVLKARD